jgi:membrane dipeptidase
MRIRIGSLLVLLLAGPLLRAADLFDPAALHQQALVFDTHCDTALDLLEEGRDLAVRGDRSQLDLPKMREGGLDAEVFALWVDPERYRGRMLARALELYDALIAAIAKSPDRIELALTVADVRRIVAAGKAAAFLGLEGGYALENSLGVLRVLHRLGVRVLTLTWMTATDWADSSNAKPRSNGLSSFGKQVVTELNRLGVVVDLSHASDKTFFDALTVTTKPVIVSHSACRALADNPRNLTDDMLRALAKNGGVIGINFFPGFLDTATGQKNEALRQKMVALKRQFAADQVRYKAGRDRLLQEFNKDLAPISIERLVDHIDHAVQVAGIDHVGLGSDFDGIHFTPVGLEDASKLPALTERLFRRGYSAEDIRKILGENMLRVFEQAIGQ